MTRYLHTVRTRKGSYRNIGLRFSGLRSIESVVIRGDHMLFCELAEMYPISDSVCCQDCPEFKFCPVVNDDVGDSDD